MSTATGLKPLIISAPFGNYVQPSGATATLGTFTRHNRPGRVWRILKTVRRYRRLGAWVNKIGLRNPGIDWLESKVASGKIDVSDKLVSIHGFDEQEWWGLLDAVARMNPLGVELNISCPNVGEMSWPAELFSRAITSCAGSTVIVKLPPVRYEEMLRQALDAGVRVFHCCNTLPVPAGGMSGKPLKPLALICVGRVLESASQRGVEIDVIGGGGITTPDDIDDYANAGAKRVAVGTMVMHPKYLWSDRGIRPLIDHAVRVLG
ncbi:MAG: hypothetical protein RLN60_00640 [Phycisphaerales bacterium]